MAWGESWMTGLGASCRGGQWQSWWMGRSQPSPLMCYPVCHREQYWAPYYSLCIAMTSLIKCPQVPSVDYLQMTACYTGQYTHWRTSLSCSVILMHFRGGPSCGVCGSIRRSATSCTFAELSPPKCHIFMNYVTQCCFFWRTPSTWESGFQRISAGECRLMLLVKRLTPGCTSSSGTSRAPQALQGAGFPGTCEIRLRLLLHCVGPPPQTWYQQAVDGKSPGCPYCF